MRFKLCIYLTPLFANFFVVLGTQYWQHSVQLTHSSRYHLFFADPTNIMASGPYGLIFASFVPFYLDIPVSSRFRIFGINFTDKSFIYLAGLQVVVISVALLFLAAFSFCNIVLISSSMLLLSASFVILETFSCTWHMWYTSWYFVSCQCIPHPKD